MGAIFSVLVAVSGKGLMAVGALFLIKGGRLFLEFILVRRPPAPPAFI